LLANKAPNIHYATSCCYIPRKRLGCSKKRRKRRRKGKIKERGQMFHSKKFIE
jgi:hypothetical protein